MQRIYKEYNKQNQNSGINIWENIVINKYYIVLIILMNKLMNRSKTITNSSLSDIICG